jgi:hypothetical protein
MAKFLFAVKNFGIASLKWGVGWVEPAKPNKLNIVYKVGLRYH